MATASNVDKKKIIAYLIEQKTASYDSMMKMQQSDMAGAEKNNEEEDGMFDSGKTGQSLNRVESRSSVVEALQDEITLLRGLDSIEANERLQLGDVIETDKGNFFVAVPEEEFTVEGVSFRGISTDSPLFQALADKKNGEKAEVNGNQFLLRNSY